MLAYEDALRDRATAIGLISAKDAGRLRDRHVLDCLRAAAAVGRADRTAYDLGSGAGLPGIVVAVARPDLQVFLVDARRNRVGFLENAVDELRLRNVAVLAARIEDLHDPVDLCFARALAPVGRAWQLSRSLLRPGGRLVYFAGSGFVGADLPSSVGLACLLRTAVLESAGPLVIMAER